MSARRRFQRGVTMLEVLITIFIVSFGMLGLAGLQARMLLAQVEAYQRAQAVTILKNMVARLHAAHPTTIAARDAYVTATPRGTDVGLQNCAGLLARPWIFASGTTRWWARVKRAKAQA
jgi:type IV pilus assembly protein PilV